MSDSVAVALQDWKGEFSIDALVLGSKAAELLGVPTGTIAEPGSELWHRHQELVREEIGS